MQQCEAFFKFPLAKLLITIVLFVISPALHAQEICDNGRDDDGDMLTDINDPDCQCYWQATKNILLNPSFETYKHCLAIPDFVENVDMINDWKFGTTDLSGYPIFYYNIDCPEYVDLLFAYPKTTIQDGKALIRLTNDGSYDIPEMETGKTYLAQCLQTPLSKDKKYTLTLYGASFHSPSSLDEIPFTLGIFGHSDCNAVPISISGSHGGCPTNYNGWVLLGSSEKIYSKDKWTPVKIDLTIPKDINVIEIGPDCSLLPQRVTFFLDNLQLAETKDFVFHYIQIQSGSACTGSYVLAAPVFDNAIYQWYRNGIALAGQKGNTCSVPDSIAEGTFNVRIIKDGNCKISEPLTLQLSKLLQLRLPADTFICKNDTLRLGKVMPGVRYRWRGKQDSIVTVSEPGVYNITASDTSGCTKDFIVNTTFQECTACTVFMPDAFTPNGDGLNDVFKGNINCPVDEYHLSIFNRWGQNVFQSDTINNGWDGTFRGNKPDIGVYIYFIRFKNAAFEKTYKTKKGTVVIIR